MRYYDDPKIKEKWRKANLKRYKENPELKYEITKKANETIRKKSLEKFKLNPTTKISKRGYRMIYIPLKGWKREHHYTWERAGRNIPCGMILHHINFNKLDNRLENLQLMNKQEHSKLHYAKRIINKYGQLL